MSDGAASGINPSAPSLPCFEVGLHGQLTFKGPALAVCVCFSLGPLLRLTKAENDRAVRSE